MYGSLYLTRVSRYFSVICKSTWANGADGRAWARERDGALSSDWLHAPSGWERINQSSNWLTLHSHTHRSDCIMRRVSYVYFCNYWFRLHSKRHPLTSSTACILSSKAALRTYHLWIDYVDNKGNEKCFHRFHSIHLATHTALSSHLLVLVDTNVGLKTSGRKTHKHIPVDKRVCEHTKRHPQKVFCCYCRRCRCCCCCRYYCLAAKKRWNQLTHYANAHAKKKRFSIKCISDSIHAFLLKHLYI